MRLEVTLFSEYMGDLRASLKEADIREIYKEREDLRGTDCKSVLAVLYESLRRRVEGLSADDIQYLLEGDVKQ